MANISDPPSPDNHRRWFSTFCDGQAALYGRGFKSLIDAVDRCQDHAVAYGYIAAFGQDEVQRLMHQAFKPYRKDLPWSTA